MNTTHFGIMNNMNTNMIHMMHHHNTTETMSNVTGVDLVIIIVGFILLLWGGVKLTEWLLDKTDEMKKPWDGIMLIVGMFSYITIGGVVISLFVSLF